MRYDSVTKKIKHKRFGEIEVTGDVPQGETLTDLVDFAGGEDRIIGIINSLIEQRAFASTRQRAGNDETSENTPENVRLFLEKEAESIKEYSLSSERGTSDAYRFKQIKRQLEGKDLNSLGADELRAMLAQALN